jgi:hypothetical protein
LREGSDKGTVWVARASARIGVIGGKRERRIRTLVNLDSYRT